MPNPPEVIEQITYLLFIRRLDELETMAENEATRTRKPVDRPTFTGPDDERRRKNFRQVGPQEMFAVVSTEVFPLLQKCAYFGSVASSVVTSCPSSVRAATASSRDRVDLPTVRRRRSSLSSRWATA